MKNFFAQLPYKIGAFMVGRRGMDNFNVALLVTSVICMVLEILFGWRVLSWVSFVLLIVCCVRCYSKNIAAREKESQDHEVFSLQRVRANSLHPARQGHDAHCVPEMQNRDHEEVVRRCRGKLKRMSLRSLAFPVPSRNRGVCASIASCAMPQLRQWCS